jgi:hypothetical protein
VNPLQGVILEVEHDSIVSLNEGEVPRIVLQADHGIPGLRIRVIATQAVTANTYLLKAPRHGVRQCPNWQDAQHTSLDRGRRNPLCPRYGEIAARTILTAGTVMDSAPRQRTSREGTDNEQKALGPHASCLTISLRGRATTPARRRGRTVSSRARGAKQEAHHGPLQRLLDAKYATTLGRRYRYHMPKVIRATPKAADVGSRKRTKEPITLMLTDTR